MYGEVVFDTLYFLANLTLGGIPPLLLLQQAFWNSRGIPPVAAAAADWLRGVYPPLLQPWD